MAFPTGAEAFGLCADDSAGIILIHPTGHYRLLVLLVFLLATPIWKMPEAGNEYRPRESAEKISG